MRNPFRGVSPFTEHGDDWRFFYQREEEIRRLSTSLRNFNITVLFGENGAGKTSLLRAGVFHNLLLEAQKNTETLGAPIIAVGLLPTSTEDAPDLVTCHTTLIETIGEFIGSTNFLIPAPENGLGFREIFSYWAKTLGGFRRRGAILLVLDDFEIYLQHLPSSERVVEFLIDISNIVYAEDINVNLLLSVRSSAFSELSKIRHLFPDIFDHSLELLPLTSQQAERAIRSTIDLYNETKTTNDPNAHCEDELIEKVITGLIKTFQPDRDGLKMLDGGTVADRVTSCPTTAPQRIEAVCVQIVMSHLWDVGVKQWEVQGKIGNIDITNSELETLGGVQRIFHDYFDARMRELPLRTRDIVGALFPYLVAPSSGTGFAHRTDDLFEYLRLAHSAQVGVYSLDEMLHALRDISKGRNRILRELPDKRFEIFAHLLGLPIVDWVQKQKWLDSLLQSTLRAKQNFSTSQAQGIDAVLRCAIQLVNEIRHNSSVESHPAVFAIVTTLREMLGVIREKRLDVPGVQMAGPVRSIAFGGSVGGELPPVLAAHADGTVVVWEQQQRPGRVKVIPKNEGSLMAIDCWGPGPGMLAMAFWSGRVLVWDLLSTHADFKQDSAVWAIRISPNGQILATGSGDGTVRTWLIRKGKPSISIFHANVVHFVDFSDDSSCLLSVSWDGSVRLTNMDSKVSLESRLEKKTLFYTGAVYGHTRKLVAAGTWGGRVYVFDESMSCRGSFKAHDNIIARMKFLRREDDSPHLMTISWDGNAKEWKLLWKVSETGKKELEPELVGEFCLGSGPIHSAAIDDEGRYAAAALWDGAAHLWDLAAHPPLAERRDLVQLADVELAHYRPAVFYVSFSTDGQTVATAARDGKIRLWNWQNGSWEPRGKPFRAHEKSVYCVSFSPCLKEPLVLATASHDGTVKLWDADGNFLAECLRGKHKAHDAHVYRIGFSPKGNWLASASEDGSSRLWSINGELRCEVKHGGPVFSVNFDPQGKCFATCSADCTLGLWRIDGTRIVLLSSPEAITQLNRSEVPTAFRAINFNHDGSILASVSDSGFVILWHLNRDRDGYPLSGYPEKFFQAHRGLSFSVHFSPNQPILATAAWDGCVRLWDIEGRQQAEYRDHRNWVYNAVFSPDGQWLATASADGTAKLRRILTTLEDLDQLIAQASAWFG